MGERKKEEEVQEDRGKEEEEGDEGAEGGKEKVGRGRDKMAEKRKEGGDTWRRYVLMGVPPESAGGTQVRWREEERARSFR